jgi:class 3 adenylate cyclase/tetratricopeptide (TPR) repeat protein
MVICQGCDAINREGVSACERCGAAIGAACIQCGAGNPSLARFCCGCGARLDAPSSFPPTASPGRPERRQITVMFSDLVGSSALSERLGPEDWHQLVHRIHSQCGELVARHHGHVAQYLGDGLLAYFGYPIAAEDAPRLAVTVGLKLPGALAAIGADIGVSLEVRVGIHTGSVVVGNVGSRVHQESLALGATPNLAARVQEMAPAGAVVVSSDTYRRVDGYFEARDLGEHALRGFAQRARLYQVVAEKGPRSRLEAASASGLTPLVGRHAEFAVMQDAWSAALTGTPPVLLLTGEPGIGKSRLIHALGTRARDRRSRIELRCSEHGRRTAFSSVLESLQRHAEIRHGEPADAIRAKLGHRFEPFALSDGHVAAVASLLGVPIEPSCEFPAGGPRAAMLEALTAWIIGEAADDPRLVVVEDLHWADPSTLQLLTLVLERTAQRRLLVVMSARPEFAPPWTLDRLKTVALGRLTTEDAGAIIGSVAGDSPLPPELVDRLIARAEGIPLFLEEMTKAMLESGFLRQTSAGYVLDDSTAGRAIPATLHDSLLGRLDQLGQNKALAQVAAVLGREFSFGLFEAVWRRIPSAPAIDLTRGLQSLVGAQLIAPVGEPAEGMYQFRHSLLQDAAYESLLRATTRDYHRHVANAFVEVSPARAAAAPEVVAHHYSAAHQSDKAVEYWGMAGERSIAASAYAEAISHFGAALEQLAKLADERPRVRQELDLRARLGVALITTRGFTANEVEENYARASELCAALGDELPYRVLYGIWAVNLIRGDLASTQRMVPHIERLAEQRTDAESVLIANVMLSGWSFFRADYPDTKRRCLWAMERYDRERPKEQHGALLLKHGFEGMIWPACWLLLCQAVTGDADGARTTWREVADLSQRIADPYVLVGAFAFGALMSHELGDLATAAELSANARALAEEKGFVHWAAIATIISGSCEVGRRATDSSVATVQEGLKLLKAVGDRGVYIHYMSYLANAYLQQNRASEAIDVLQEALDFTRTHIARFCEPELLRLLGEARAAKGDLDAAVDCLSSASELARTHGAHLYELRVALSLARLLESRGNAAQAAKVIGPAREYFQDPVDFPLLRQVDQFLQSLSTERTA